MSKVHLSAYKVLVNSRRSWVGGFDQGAMLHNEGKTGHQQAVLSIWQAKQGSFAPPLGRLSLAPRFLSSQAF